MLPDAQGLDVLFCLVTALSDIVYLGTIAPESLGPMWRLSGDVTLHPMWAPSNTLSVPFAAIQPTVLDQIPFRGPVCFLIVARIPQKQRPQKWPFHITPIQRTLDCSQGYFSPVRWLPLGTQKMDCPPNSIMYSCAAIRLFIECSSGDLPCIRAAKHLEQVPTSSICSAYWSGHVPTALRPAYGHVSRPTRSSHTLWTAHVVQTLTTSPHPML